MTGRYLKEYFGHDTRIDRITRDRAADWEGTLARGELAHVRKRKQFEGKSNSRASVCQHVRNAKVIFGQAARDDLIPLNPFDRLTGKAPDPDKNWRYLTLEEFEDLLSSSPNIEWRVFLGLLRLAGLRLREALQLRWSDIDWQPDSNVPIRMTIIEAAGLKQWSKLFQVLRRNCETDWAQDYPQHVVSTWIGHTIDVSARHYLQVPEELYEKAAQNATKSATKRGLVQIRWFLGNNPVHWLS